VDDRDARVARTRRTALAAVLDVVRDEGLGALTQARVAERAGIGRATVYRHWPNVRDLLFDALSEAELTDHAVPTGDVRRDLIDELLAFKRSMTKSDIGRVMTAVIDQAEWDADMAAIRCRLTASGTSVLRNIIRRGRASGDLPVANEQQLVARLVGPLVFRRFFSGEPITRPFVAEVVDQALTGARSRS
jgi:AcrR family transcriptional regulator